jgi:hypothetical protein
MKQKLLLLWSILFLSFSVNAQSWNWSSSFGSSSGNDEVRDVVIDNQGNVYVTGIFTNTVQTDVDTIISAGGDDIFVAKYDSTGGITLDKGRRR